jgi:hypothetical protein
MLGSLATAAPRWIDIGQGTAMTQPLKEITIPPAAGAPVANEGDEPDHRGFEKLLLGSVAAFMAVWLSLLGWLAWWFLN